MSNVSVTNIGTNISTATPSTLVVTVPAGGVPKGSLIVVCTGENVAVTNGTCADSKSNTYTVATSTTRGGAAGTGIIFYAWNVTALVSGDTITYTLAGAHACSMTACYVSGAINASNPLDATGSNSGSSNAPTVTSSSPANSGDLFIGFVSMSAASGLSTFTQDSTNAAWATPPNSTFSGGIEGAFGGSVVNNAATTRTYAPTTTATTPLWAALIVSFKTGQAPSYDYPNPVLSRYSSVAINSQQSYVDWIIVDATTPQVSTNQYPNPQIPWKLDGTHLINYVRNYAVVPQTFLQYDWPNPTLGKVPAIETKTWIQTLIPRLVGKDIFFGLAGQPQRNWPNPIGPTSYDLRQGYNPALTFATSIPSIIPIVKPISPFSAFGIFGRLYNS